MIPSLTLAQGWPARLADTSAIVGFIDDLAPEQPDQFSVVGVEISDAPYPGVPDSVDEPPDPGPPPDVVLSEDVDEQVRRSVVKVSGQACKQTQTGSGWVTTDGLVVTNAHVVAGEHDVGVEDAQGDKHDATVVLFDPVRDLALLDVATLAAPGLELAEGHAGDDGRCTDTRAAERCGSRRDRCRPSRLSDQRHLPRTAERTRHPHAPCHAEHGDSGAAVVNGKGAVIGVAFAVVDDHPPSTPAWRLRTVRCGRHSPPSDLRRASDRKLPVTLTNDAARAILPSVIVVYGGAQVDAQDRSQPRFRRRTSMPSRIGTRRLGALRPRLVVGAAASGADLLVLAAARAEGIPAHIVLPFAMPRFLETSVATRGAAWEQRFTELVAGADVEVLDEHEDDDVYRRTNAALVARGPRSRSRARRSSRSSCARPKVTLRR